MLSATDNGFVWVLLSIFIPSQIAVMILMSKFSKADGVVDVLDDRIGMLGRAIFSQPHFKSDALRLKSELLERLSEQNYVMFTANVNTYDTWRIGEAKLFYVTNTRRGALNVFSDKVIRIICVGIRRYARELMAGAINTTAEHYEQIRNACLDMEQFGTL
jgi:hypothetical protein